MKFTGKVSIIGIGVLIASTAYGGPIPITEDTESYVVKGVNSIQPGTLFLCEDPALALGLGSCADRGKTQSDAVIFSIVGGTTMSILYKSDLEPGEKPQGADGFDVTPIAPFLSVGEPNGNLENVKQTYLYKPMEGQPGYALTGTTPGQGQALTYSITSDTPEPASAVLLVIGACCVFGYKRSQGWRRVSS